MFGYLVVCMPCVYEFVGITSRCVDVCGAFVMLCIGVYARIIVAVTFIVGDGNGVGYIDVGGYVVAVVVVYIDGADVC